MYEETKEEAYENFQRLNGNNALTQWTTPDMLQFAFRIKLVNPEQYSVVKEEFSGTAGVSEVRDQREVVEPLFRVLGAARTAALGLGAIMVVAAILLISTTIRLSAMSREQETQIMRYVGASNLFIQAPFMIEGALAALVGAAFAIGFVVRGRAFHRPGVDGTLLSLDELYWHGRGSDHDADPGPGGGGAGGYRLGVLAREVHEGVSLMARSPRHSRHSRALRRGRAGSCARLASRR